MEKIGTLIVVLIGLFIVLGLLRSVSTAMGETAKMVEKAKARKKKKEGGV